MLLFTTYDYIDFNKQRVEYCWNSPYFTHWQLDVDVFYDNLDGTAYYIIYDLDIISPHIETQQAVKEFINLTGHY